MCIHVCVCLSHLSLFFTYIYKCMRTYIYIWSMQIYVRYEHLRLYQKARDFVVGKEAVAGALAKVKANSGALAAVEQEQIRNLYRKADGTYSAYMCKQCSFGPIDHFACSG